MKIGMLFPDYGSQFVGMGKDLYDNSRLIQEYFEEASNCLNMNFVKLCFASSDIELSKIVHAYPALFLVSSSIAAYLKKHDIEPCMVGGFNFGEYAALCTAKSLSLPDGLYFLSKYAHYYQELLDQSNTYKALQIKGIDANNLKNICSSITNEEDMVAISAYYADDVHAIAGITKAVDEAQGQIIDWGASVDYFPVEAGLHSKLMTPVVKQLSMYIEKIDFNDASIPFVTGVDGAKIEQGITIKNHIMNQIQVAVSWQKVIETIQSWDIIIEVGPGSTLNPLISKLYPQKDIFIINKHIDVENLLTFLKNKN